MSVTTIPPPRRPDLLVRPYGNDGEYVVKDPSNGAYYNLPAQEAYLLAQLDDTQTVVDICTAFERQFGEPLRADELGEFVKMVRKQGLLVNDRAAPTPRPDPTSTRRRLKSALYFRFSFFDPDSLFKRLEPMLRFVWTAAFFWTSLALIFFAAAIFWANFAEYTEYLPESLRWESFVLAWFVLLLVTTSHEFAHGLTCKHYGGEVHELGFLMMFFMPCFYANVSDAWLFKEKSRRLWVTFAGGYHDLCLWAVAVLAWRVLLPHSLPYHVAWIVLAILGGRILLNFNPLLRLDGYYLLGDLLDIPNLRPNSFAHVTAYLRWLLWGAPRPAPEPRGRALIIYGVLSRSFAVFYVTLMFFGLFYLLREGLGLAVTAGLLSVLGWLVYPSLLRGIFQGEVWKMLRYRHARVAAWAVVLAALSAVCYLVPVDDWVSGTFRTRATVRQEVRAPVTGFLLVVYHDEGSLVQEGSIVACLEIPDLTSKLAQKQAEIAESQAKLELLLAGTRPEQLAEQRQKVTRFTDWRNRAHTDLARKTTALTEELDRLNREVGKAQTQVSFSQIALDQARRLLKDNALPQEQYREAERQYLVAKEELGKAEAQKRERVAVGTLEQEGELAKRAKELGDEVALLNIMEAGSRPEEIDAERARLTRLEAERAYLKGQQDKLQLYSPVRGVIVTPYLRERIGQYFTEGDLICEIEDPQSLEIEIPIEEQDVGRIEPKMAALLKPRALPLHTCEAEVERLAPQALAGKVQSTVTVYCRLRAAAPELVSGMTGYARIYCGRTSIGGYIGGRALRYVRTEVWW